eukprot:scaffold14097_cov120-Skeletonema_dohrnii-CCMP3373.AAC.2
MANYNGSLEAVDCHIHSVRYDMAVNRGAANSDASSGHLRRCSDADTSNKCLSSREIRYGRQQRSWRPTQTPHQVTHDVVATPIRPTNA